jgi:hypothetical protein
MILLFNAVEALAGSPACETPRAASTLQLYCGTGVGLVPVDGYGARVDSADPRQLRRSARMPRSDLDVARNALRPSIKISDFPSNAPRDHNACRRNFDCDVCAFYESRLDWPAPGRLGVPPEGSETKQRPCRRPIQEPPTTKAVASSCAYDFPSVDADLCAENLFGRTACLVTAAVVFPVDAA